MAEGGGLTSINKGSDVDFEYTCSPCGDEDIRVEAVKYCPVCEEYMCATCVRHHGRPKATRSHTLLDCHASVKASPVTMVTKCRYHPNFDIDMYCGEHDMVYCAKCIAMEHRSCSGVSSLEDTNVVSNQQNEIKNLKTNTTSMQKRLEETEEHTQMNIERLEEQNSEAISKIEKIERDLIEHIRKLKQEAQETLAKEYAVVKDNLNAQISRIRRRRVGMEYECRQLQEVDDLDKRQRFIKAKMIQQTVNEGMKIVDDSDVQGCQNISFTENTELKSSVMTSTSLGHVQIVNESNNQQSSKVYKVSSKKEINVKITNDKRECYIIDICQLPDGTTILADNNDRRIKRLDVNYNIKDYLDVRHSPRAICCTGNTTVAVKLYNNKVQFISVGSSLSKLRDISITDGDYLGIAYCAGELWISTGNGVDVYSMSGTLLNSISKDFSGQNIFKSIAQQMTVSGNSVFITDSSGGAVCLKRDGTVIREFRDVRLTNSYCVCASHDGTVFIAGFSSYNIVMFDRDGKCLGELIDKAGGLKHPVSMCYDKKNNRVLVGSLDSNSLVVLNLCN